MFGTMFMIFGFVALFLASVGLYAVMSFSVSRRTREVGIRMALGAQGRDVVRMIFGQGLVQLVVGMTLGLAFAMGISQLLKVILFQVQPRDPSIFGGVAAVLIAGRPGRLPRSGAARDAGGSARRAAERVTRWR